MFNVPLKPTVLRQVLQSAGLDPHAARPPAEQQLVLCKALKLSQRMGDVSVKFNSRYGWDPSLLPPWQAAGFDIFDQVPRWFTLEEHELMQETKRSPGYTIPDSPLSIAFLYVRDFMCKLISEVRCLAAHCGQSLCLHPSPYVV